MNTANLYSESIASSEPVRARYAQSIDRAVVRLQACAAKQRGAWITPELLREQPEFYRSAYAEMLGIPVLEQAFGTGLPESVERLPAGEDEQCTITRLAVQLWQDVVFTGLFLQSKNCESNAPLIIASHGGGGSPELCSDIIGPNNYNHMVRRLLVRGADVFAPQMLLWSFHVPQNGGSIPHFETKYDRHNSDAQLKQCGSSIAGFEIYALSRTISVLLANRDASAQKCDMIGLSYGGFYTLYAML